MKTSDSADGFKLFKTSRSGSYNHDNKSREIRLVKVFSCAITYSCYSLVTTQPKGDNACAFDVSPFLKHVVHVS